MVAVAGEEIKRDPADMSYRAEVDRLLRRRALFVALGMGALIFFLLLFFFGLLFRTIRQGLVEHVSDDVATILELVADDLPPTLLTRPLVEEEGELRSTRAYLERVMTKVDMRNLALLRLTSGGHANVILGLQVDDPSKPPKFYDSIPYELPFDPAEIRPGEAWVGGLTGKVGGALTVYWPLYDQDKLVGFLVGDYSLAALDDAVNSMRAVAFLIHLTLTFLVGGVSWWFAWETFEPMKALLLPVENLLSGNLARRYPSVNMPVDRPLILAANQAAQLLEERIRDVKYELESTKVAVERRASYLAAITQIGYVISTLLDVDALLAEAARLVARYFGFYHVGLFLLDESRSWVVLRAASSEGGRRMLARQHRLRLGQGVVGYAAQTGRPRVASDVDVDIVWVPNPDLPETRSELAVPMSVRGNVIGVLDVQSTESSAFTAEDVAVLRTLAGQLAVAIDNVRLFHESQKALQEANLFRKEETRRAWERWRRRLYGYRYDATGVHPISEPLPGEQMPGGVEVERETNTLTLPIVWGGFVVGRLRLYRESSRPWTASEVRVIEAAVADISQALENARLLEEVRNRAQSEEIVAEVTARLQSLLEPEAILKETMRQLGEIITIDYGVIEVEPQVVETEAASTGRPGEQEGGRER